MNDDARKLIARLELQPLPQEGGFFRPTWSSSTPLQPGRSTGSAIYFLLTESDFSALHLLQTDELWLFHDGDPVEHIQLLATDPEAIITLLGVDLSKNETPQLAVRGGTWQGARLRPGPLDAATQRERKGWALLSCVMAPAWDEREFTLGERAQLMASFPSAASWIRALTR